MLYLALALTGAALPAAQVAQTPLEQGFTGALRGCEEWVLNPASWVDGPMPFIKATGLDQTISQVESIPAFAQPIPRYRRANHYWRISSMPTSGYYLVVSDQLPMCHLAGSGADDFRPSVTAALASPDFQNRWELVEERLTGNIVSSRYRLRRTPDFGLVVSRTTVAESSTERAQVLATASLDLGR